MKKLLSLLPFLALAGLPVGFVIHNATYSPEDMRPAAPPLEVRRQSFAPMEEVDRAVALRGRVRGEDGASVAEALVFAIHQGEPRWTLTDEDGRFELRGLGDPPFDVAVSHFDHRPAEFLVDTAEVNLSLSRLPEPPNLDELESRTLRGRLTTRDGGTLEGYELQLLPESAPDVLGGAVPRRSTAGTGGAFDVPELALGRYRLAVLPPWARGGSWPNLLPPGRRTYRHGAEGSELVLPVERGSIRGVVEGEEGVLEGAMVRVAIESEGAERVWPPVQSDVEGKFRVGDLPVEHVYTVTVRAGDGRGRTSVFVESLPADPIRIDVRDDD